MSDRPWLKSVGTSLAGFLGVLAFTVSIYGVFIQRDQALAQRQQVRATVWPRLQWNQNVGTEGFTYQLENCGVGPAEIRSAHILYDDKSPGSWLELIRAAYAAAKLPLPKELSIRTGTLKGHVLGAGRDLIAFSVTDRAVVEQLTKFAPHVTYSLCYCSVLNECWQLQDDVNTSVANCPVESGSFP